MVLNNFSVGIIDRDYRDLGKQKSPAINLPKSSLKYPSGDTKLCDHLAMVTWDFIERIAPDKILPCELFFLQH